MGTNMASDLTRDASSSVQSAGEKTEVSPSFINVPWPVRPSPGINYNFVSGMYLAGSAFAVIFFTLEKQMLASLLVNEGDQEDRVLVASNETKDETGDGDSTDPWKEFTKGIEGMYFIFAPFIPCLLWSLIVRYYWLKEIKVSSSKKDN